MQQAVAEHDPDEPLLELSGAEFETLCDRLFATDEIDAPPADEPEIAHLSSLPSVSAAFGSPSPRTAKNR